MDTPEQIELDLELAGVGSRFLAMVVDAFWKILLTLLVGGLALLVIGLFGGSGVLDGSSRVVVAVALACLYALWLGFGIYFEVRWNGQTPGKRVTGLRVLRAGGAPVDFRTACVRNLLATADFLPVFHLFGAVLVLLTPRRQRLGDLAAGTVVVRERVAALGPDPTAELLRYATDEYAFTRGQLAALTAADRTVIREFLRRYDSLVSPGAERLALSLAFLFAERMGPPEARLPDGRAGRGYLASLLRDLEAVRRHE